MWIKYAAIIILFYFFALLQNSFFVHFNLLGTVPNFVFIFFFLLVFFSAQGASPLSFEAFFYAVIAGLFLDIFLYTYFGLSAVLLLAIAFLTKKAQGTLSEKKDNFLFIYFSPLFLISLLVYKFLSGALIFDWRIAAEAAYNLFFAFILFLIYKKFFGQEIDSRQLPLFNKRV